MTRVLSSLTGLNDAVELLGAGELVAFPTETVYGLGADARRGDAVQRIYEAKGRPSGNPLIVHVPMADHARASAADWPTVADELAKRFWPGPLTLVVRRGPSLTPLVSAGRDTVAIRCPNHPVAQDLLRAFAGPIAAPSANRSGFTSPTTAAHVLAELAGRVPLILDGGPCTIGLESTVLDLSTNTPTILRPGAVTAEMLREAIGHVDIAQFALTADESAPSPGLQFRHYAPDTPAYRFTRAQWPAAQRWAQQNAPVALLSSDDHIALPAPHETIRMSSDAPAYARTLYSAIRQADDCHAHAILILMPARETGLWHAIADRLRRAASTRPEFAL